MTTLQTAPVISSAKTNPLVDATTLSQWLAKGEACLVDVREVKEHSSERIAGACLVPLSEFDAARLPHVAGRKLVLHCLSGARSQQAAQRALAGGFDEVWQLKGGINGWKAAGLPVQRDTTGPTMFAVQRQAFIVIGLGVLTGLALGYFVALPWLLLSAFFACGLLMAGVTGFCPLAIGLANMPWNRSTPAPAPGSAPGSAPGNSAPSCCAR